VSSDPPGTVVYIDASVPSRSAVATDSITGSAMIANIPVSHTTIHAMFNGKAFLDNTFDGVKGALMQAEIQP
jgi:hypothetical protein